MPAFRDSQPHLPGGTFHEDVESADISFFDKLAGEAANTRTKGAGRDLIGRRNAALQGYNPYQRYKVGQNYYSQHNKRAGDEGSFGDFDAENPNSFINLIGQGDNQFLQGLADDTGNTGGGGGGNTGNTGGGGNNNTGNTGGAGNWQELINQLLANQNDQFKNMQQQFQSSAPTLSVGSVGNRQGAAATRARARNTGGIINTLSRRGRQSSARPRRYF